MVAMPRLAYSNDLESSNSEPSSVKAAAKAAPKVALVADLPLFEQAKQGLGGWLDASKVVLARIDLNIPLASHSSEQKLAATAEPLSLARIDAVIPLIEQVSPYPLLLCSHLGRPLGEPRDELSLRRLLPHLERRWQRKVIFLGDSQKSGALDEATLVQLNAARLGQVAPEKAPIGLFENLRFHKGEEQDSLEFAANLAAKADLFVNDAFSVCHRAHASTSAITTLLPSYVGCSLRDELASLLPLLAFGGQKAIAILGGAKVSTKIKLLRSLMKHCSALVLGGNMANCMLAVRGRLGGNNLGSNNLGSRVGNKDLAGSFAQRELEVARELDAYAECQKDCEIILPCDAALAPENLGADGSYDASLAPEVVEVEKASRALWDIGPQSCRSIERLLEKTAEQQAGTRVIVNGPLGVFERPPYDASTLRLLRFLAKMTKQGKQQARHGNLRSICGGGDTVAALERAGVAEDFTHISLGGGAFLELLTEAELPALRALRICKERMREVETAR